MAGRPGKGNPNPKNQWRKGVSGNPKGPPRSGFSLVENLRAALEQLDPENGKSRGQLLAEKYVELGFEGSVTAIENIIARFHGKPEGALTLKGDKEHPIHVRHSERGTKARPRPPAA